MTKIKITPPKKSNKGKPPTAQDTSNNLDKKMDDELVTFNFRVPASFRKRVRQHALDHDMPAVRLIMEALEDRMRK